MTDITTVDVPQEKRVENRAKATTIKHHFGSLRRSISCQDPHHDECCIEHEHKCPVDIERGHALLMRWSKYSHRANRMTLFVLDGKILLSLRI